MTDKSIHANPNKHRTPRHRAREFALQGIYQWLLNASDARAVVANIRNAHGFEKADGEHFTALVMGTIKQVESLREVIAPCLDRPLQDISPVEHAVLLIAVYELREHPEVPYRVVINEAVELTKSFGGSDGHKYVNGVLDKLAPRLRAVEVAGPQAADSEEE
ncbi:transcription antitermination factor NusB [Massilia sp. W12]|uniref:transcription antitermination factor NusB n=1 Tax=Massilia sp. W12 TaxID=3126507 RepID=UPI0030D5ED1A